MNDKDFIVLDALYRMNQREPVRFDELISPIYDTYLMNVSILKAVLERLEHKGYVYTFHIPNETCHYMFEKYEISITFAGLWYHHLYKKKINIL